MRIRYMTLLFLLLLVVCSVVACGLSAGQKQGVKSMVKMLFVPKRVFLEITNGSSLEAVRNKLGIAARHEFTMSEKGSNYTMICCSVCPTDDIQYSSDFYLLFCDKSLIKCVPDSAIQGEGMTNIDDARLILKAINARGMSQAQILDILRPYQGKSGSLNVLPGFLLLAPLAVFTGYFDKIAKDYQTNQELLKKYDGCRASLGMTTEEIVTLFGEPLRVFSTEDGQTARIYGDNQDIDKVNPLFPHFSYVAVVFDAQGHVRAIYSQDFFNDAWKK